MGATGSGKTSVSGAFLSTTTRNSLGFPQFINLASGSGLRIRMDSESCTAEVQLANEFILGGRTVTLIDTPGFGGTSKNDMDILKMIAGYLADT